MIIGIIDALNECNFAVKVANDVNIDKVKEYLKAGLDAWYQAANEDLENENFDPDDMKDFYYSGYSEPTSELLNRSNIVHEVIDIDFDDEGNAINLDGVVNY